MSGFSQLLSASFETVPWVWMTFLRTEKGEKHFKCFHQVLLLVSFVQSLNLLPQGKEGRKEGRKDGRRERKTQTKLEKDERSAKKRKPKTV